MAETIRDASRAQDPWSLDITISRIACSQSSLPRARRPWKFSPTNFTSPPINHPDQTSPHNNRIDKSGPSHVRRAGCSYRTLQHPVASPQYYIQEQNVNVIGKNTYRPVQVVFRFRRIHDNIRDLLQYVVPNFREAFLVDVYQMKVADVLTMQGIPWL